MSEQPAPMTPAHIWREMTSGQRLAAAQALWADEESGAQQADAIQVIARQLRFRPQSVLRLTPDKLAHHLASIRTISESLASRMLIVHHLASQRPMLAAFLGRLGIANDDGLIKDGVTTPPDPARLREAAESLRGQFAAEDVRVYLLTLAAQDPDAWSALAPIATELFPAGPRG